MKRENMIKLITKLISNTEYKYYGLRYADTYEEGQTSRMWELGEVTDGCLSGLSVIEVNESNIEEMLDEISYYSSQGRHLFLLASNEAYPGSDKNEKVLDEEVHVCLKKFR